MILKYLHIHNVRNISEVKISFSEGLNILYGENGSGKSSVLESIYLLSSGKSFRSRHITKIIKLNKHKLTLFGKLEDVNKSITLGIEKTVSGHEIRINGEPVKQISQLAKCLPVLIVTQDSHKLLESGPQWRRQFIDWGLFHVKHDFHGIWSNYRKLLKNRNQALINRATKQEVEAWNTGLAEYGNLYSALREKHIESILPLFQEFTSLLLGENNCNLVYKRGWLKNVDLLECLNNQYEKDSMTRRTAIGPHRSDLTVTIGDRDAKDHVSRGQQKLLVYALNLAQIAYLKQVSKKETLLLLDDLGAELDTDHSRKLLTLISERFTQVCITTANLDSLPLSEFKDAKMFHVEHGSVQIPQEAR